MKISYNWLKEYFQLDLPAEKLAGLLTDAGLEVENFEKAETVKGGLRGIVIGEVKSKIKHPNADKLSLTTVDIGSGTLLNIVCGASNVEAGQKVPVAMVGSTLHTFSGEQIEIKKSKIRGELSEGMICAEDEIGLGPSHEGIMVLDPEAKTGTPAAEYFKIEEDFVFEIGLTPNRADATSHMGVVRDLFAIFKYKSTVDPAFPAKLEINIPPVEHYETDNESRKIGVIVEDKNACPRYTAVTISNIEVKESPEWLKRRLLSIGVRPINNIVDITNFILHELGQPLHAFDADQIEGDTVVVKKLATGTKFVTLDGVERTLTENDLMICNIHEPMCIAGVYGGLKSGVSEKTKNIFLESAYFNPVSIRKTSRHHGLKTDASFRFERGADPDCTVYAIKRAALLIKELAGGEISSEIVDVYPDPIEPFRVAFSFKNCYELAGKEIDKSIVKNILQSLDIEIVSEGSDAIALLVPPYRVDVQRECDVIEEIMRIYGYNNIEEPEFLHTSLAYAPRPDREKTQNIVSDMLSARGFNEIMSTSLTRNEYAALLNEGKAGNGQVGSQAVHILNPLSSDLGILRTTLLFSGLEAIVYNRNRKNPDLKFYEFGKSYHKTGDKYSESAHLALFITGNKLPENWAVKTEHADFYQMKSAVNNVLEKLGIEEYGTAEASSLFTYGLSYEYKKKKLLEFGAVNRSLLKAFDIGNDVFYADLNWDELVRLASKVNLQFKELPKFPAVRRDLSMMLDQHIPYSEIEQLAFNTEKNLLRKVNLFDVYQGDKIEQGKKSYAVSYILQSEEATLTDEQIDAVIGRLIKAYEKKAGAVIRGL